MITLCWKEIIDCFFSSFFYAKFIFILMLFLKIFFYQLEANYFTILQWVLSCIDMNQPWIYMYSPSQSPLPPPSPPDPSRLHIYMEFRKMLMITLYAKQKKRHRCIKQTFGHCGRRRGWDVSREQHRNMYIIKGETDHQPRLDA